MCGGARGEETRAPVEAVIARLQLSGYRAGVAAVVHAGVRPAWGDVEAVT